MFSESLEKATPVRIELGVGTTGSYTWKGKVLAYNGTVSKLQGWHTDGGDNIANDTFQIETNRSAKGLVFEVHGADPAPVAPMILQL